MISTIASAYDAAAEHGMAEPHAEWLRAWQRFSDDWQAGGRATPAELTAYLAEVPKVDRPGATWDLVAEHLRLSWQEGQGRLLDDYRELLEEAGETPADLVEDEFLARFATPHGDWPGLAEYADRFGGRADVLARLSARCLAAERYVKLRVLGAGGLGVVYEAVDRLMQRRVAVKETALAGEAAEWRQKQLAGEARLTAEMNHGGVVAIYDEGRSERAAYYVMSLVVGRPLNERIGEYHSARATAPVAERRRLLKELVGCLVQVCEAVGHAHERRIVHRDLKPGNVIVGEEGAAVIVDWGLARRLCEPAAGACGARGIVGTPQYMAPEQTWQQEDERSDVYSLGATLFELLAGRPPHHWPAGGIPADWPAVVREARIRRPRDLAPDAPRPLEAICLKALAKTPEKRQASVAELAAELRGFLESGKSGGWWSWFSP